MPHMDREHQVRLLILPVLRHTSMTREEAKAFVLSLSPALRRKCLRLRGTAFSDVLKKKEQARKALGLSRLQPKVSMRRKCGWPLGKKRKRATT